jgi:hypothetical protein
MVTGKTILVHTKCHVTLDTSEITVCVMPLAKHVTSPIHGVAVRPMLTVTCVQPDVSKS